MSLMSTNAPIYDDWSLQLAFAVLDAGRVERWESLRETIQMVLGGIGLRESTNSAAKIWVILTAVKTADAASRFEEERKKALQDALKNLTPWGAAPSVFNKPLASLATLPWAFRLKIMLRPNKRKVAELGDLTQDPLGLWHVFQVELLFDDAQLAVAGVEEAPLSRSKPIFV